MKKIFLIAIMASFAMTSFAQVDLKINPLGLLFGNPDVAAEFGLNDNFGVEAGVGALFGTVTGTGIVNGDYKLKKSGLKFFTAGKYYFSPDEGFDRFGVGLYVKGKNYKTTADNEEAYTYKRTTLGAGILLTYKWVGASGILFEIVGGGGRAFVDKLTWEGTNGGEYPGLGIDALFKLNLGYRFGGNN